MPYSRLLIPNRQAVGRTTYQLRKFMKDVQQMDIPEPFKAALLSQVKEFERMLKGAVIDFDDDGTILKGSPDNDLILGKHHG